MTKLKLKEETFTLLVPYKSIAIKFTWSVPSPLAIVQITLDNGAIAALNWPKLLVAMSIKKRKIIYLTAELAAIHIPNHLVNL